MTTPSVSRVIFADGTARYHSELPQEVGEATQGHVAGAINKYVYFKDYVHEGVLKLGLVPADSEATMVRISKMRVGIIASWMPGGGRALFAIENANGDDSFWHTMCLCQEPDQEWTEDFNQPTIMLPKHRLCMLHQWQPHAAGWTSPWGWSTYRSASFQIEYKIIT